MRVAALTAVPLLMASICSAWAEDAVSSAMPREPYVDEAPKDPSFVAFRRNLQGTIRRRDGKALMQLIAPDCANIIGSPPGPADFRSEWKPEQAKSDMWAPLELLLREGGVFSDANTFRAPYVFWTPATAALPREWEDEVVAVTDAKAALLVEPKPNAAIVRKLDYDVLQPIGAGYMGLQNEAGPLEWLNVVDAAGKTGFVRARQVRSIVWDFRAEFTKRNGRWWITLFQFSD